MNRTERRNCTCQHWSVELANLTATIERGFSPMVKGFCVANEWPQITQLFAVVLHSSKSASIIKPLTMTTLHLKCCDQSDENWRNTGSNLDLRLSPSPIHFRKAKFTWACPICQWNDCQNGGARRILFCLAPPNRSPYPITSHEFSRDFSKSVISHSMKSAGISCFRKAALSSDQKFLSETAFGESCGLHDSENAHSFQYFITFGGDVIHLASPCLGIAVGGAADYWQCVVQIDNAVGSTRLYDRNDRALLWINRIERSIMWSEQTTEQLL